MNIKIVDLTTEELADLGYLTDKVAPGIKKRVERVLANPKHLGQVTVFMVECSIRHNARQAAAPQVAADPPASSTSTASDADTLFSRYSSHSLAFIVVAPDLISKYESDLYYHGLSGCPPPLLWRSDLEDNPFPAPRPGDSYFFIPVKTAHGVIGSPLTAVWPAPVRFSIVEGDGDERLGPVVVWIAIPPNSAEAGAVRDATPDILHILAEAQITGVVVEWYLGTITKLVDLA
ncbi:hypothetical protein EV121DRAFT_293989 [Schizophyllum commune]